jgi:hypothetical protein
VLKDSTGKTINSIAGVTFPIYASCILGVNISDASS